MTFSAIVAFDENYIIGDGINMPWHLPADLKHFKQITTGHTIVMGRKTFQSLPKGALPNRRNIVLSHQPDYKLMDAEVVHSIDELQTKVVTESEVFIIGGAQIYRLFMPLVKKIYTTQIHHTFNASVYFPLKNFSQWHLLEKQDFTKDEKNKWNYSFSVWKKISE